LKDPKVLGKVLSVNHVLHTIIGVMPEDFEFPETQYNFWLPLEAGAAQSPRDYRSGRILARLQPGVSLESAQKDISRIAGILGREYPATNNGYGLLLEDYRKMDLPIDEAVVVKFVYLAVTFVLLIACANVSSLLLAKATGRNQEIAIRASIGGSRNRLLRQLLTESILIAASGGVLGILASFIWLKGTLAIVPPDMPNRERISIDGISLIYTAGIAFLSSLIFGILPALRSTGKRELDALKEASRASAGRARHRLLNGFIILETALVVVLLIASSLLVRSYRNEISVNPGFDRANLLTVQLQLPESMYVHPGELAAVVETAVNRFKDLLGTRMVAATQKLPMAGGLFGVDTFSVQDGSILPNNQRPSASGMSVTKDYFSTLHVPLLQGRHFSESDSLSHPVAIIGENIANRYLGDTPNPIGRMIRFDNATDKRWMEIVGVVGDVHVWNLKEPPMPQIYMPYAQLPSRIVALVARTVKDPLQYAGAAKSVLHSIDPEQPTTIQTMEEIIDSGLSGTKMLSKIIGSITVFALVLAALGIYSVISYAVSERTHEIGIRVAFGAQKLQICRMILGKGMVLLGTGLCVGAAGALILMRFLRMLWFGVTPDDPISYVTTGIVLMATGILAIIVPARRAMSVDPMVAIRHE
jgi:putative ABC transport system permease protein